MLKNICLLVFFVLFSGATFKKKDRILVFSKTTAHRHSSIKVGKQAILKLGAANGLLVDTTEDASQFNRKNLKKYSAVVFLITTGPNILDSAQRKSFEKYIHSGGGYVGIHGASDSEYDWEWYGKLVGGRFEGHPPEQSAKVNVIDKNHPATRNIPAIWERHDEWYNFKNLQPTIKVLMKLDETSYKGGKHKNDHPIAWCQEFEGGRSFYTELGHTPKSYSEPLYLTHLLGGIKWAMGRDK